MSDFPRLANVRSLSAVKNDKSLLFTKLNELKAKHRVIMTGTPLNNNIRELFNLMNFLDPDNWSDLEALETEYEELTEDLVKQCTTVCGLTSCGVSRVKFLLCHRRYASSRALKTGF